MPLSYLDHFRCTRVWSIHLQRPEVLAAAKAQGYQWVRRLDGRRFEQIVCNPTVGCILELCVLQQVGCVPIDSPKAKRWIRRLCYF